MIKDLYWKTRAYKEDEYANNFIYAECPPDADHDTVVARIDRVARQQGGLATDIVRAFAGEPNAEETTKESGGGEDPSEAEAEPVISRAERYRKGYPSRYDGYFPEIHHRGPIPERARVLQEGQQSTKRRRQNRNRG